MNAYRRSALAAGSLLIIATVAQAILGSIVVKPVVGDPVDLVRIAANDTQVYLGALLQLIGAAACAGIALALYPVLRTHGPALALGSVVFRVIESTFYVASIVGLLLLVTLGSEAARAGAVEAALYERLAALVVAARTWLGFVVAVAFFGLGALCYYWVLYRAALVPHWLSGWGIVAAVAALVAATLAMFGVAAPLTPVHIVLNLPIAVQEMVLAGYLIAKGFRPVEPVASASPAGLATATTLRAAS